MTQGKVLATSALYLKRTSYRWYQSQVNLPPKKKRVANSNSEEPIVNLRRSTKAKVDIEAEVTQNLRDNKHPRVTRTNPLDEAATRLLDRLAHVASRGAGRVQQGLVALLRLL